MFNAVTFLFLSSCQSNHIIKASSTLSQTACCKVLTLLLKNRHDMQPTALYSLSSNHLCDIIPTLLCQKGRVYSAVYHFFMLVKPLMKSVSQNRMWKIDHPLKALWKGTQTCSHLKENIVCKYEKKNRYHMSACYF